MIEGYINKGNSTASDLEGDSVEYELIVNSNNLTIEIDNELLIIHKVSPFPSPPFLPRTDTAATTTVYQRSLPPTIPRTGFPSSPSPPFLSSIIGIRKWTGSSW